MIKLLYSEKSKRKGKSFVYFLVGNRVNQYLTECFRREREMTSVLNGGPEYHASLAEKALKNSTKYKKSTQNLLKELALLKAGEIKTSQAKYFSEHRTETEMDFCNVLLNELPDLTIFVSMGTEKNFSFVLQSSEKDIKELSKQIMAILEAKGGGKGQRINGKFTSLAKRTEVDKYLAKYFDVQ